jgi:5'-methylthioadenosine phosphorylase
MKIGIIGGSGFYALNRLNNPKEVSVNTPFGPPSDAVMSGTFGNHEIFFLPRHGRGHRIMPSEINHCANIFALKSLGVERAISITSVGSLKEDRVPGDIVLPDQYFDRTKQNHTFYRDLAVHVPFGEPTCDAFRNYLGDIAQEQATQVGHTAFTSGTYVNMEGPVFSTKAESHFYRGLDASVVGMTSLPEAKLCREAEICYSAMAMVTDFDCWHEEEGHVTAADVVIQAQKNVELATNTMVAFLERLDDLPDCHSGCGSALSGAIMTHLDTLSDEIKNNLKPLIGHLL